MADEKIGAQELSELLGVLPDFLALVGTDRRVRFVNRAAEGYDPREVLGMDLLDFLAPEVRDQQAEMFARVVETGEPDSYEVPVVDAEGGRQWYEGVLYPVTRDGKVSMVAMVTRNVTARRRAEHEVEMLRRLLPVCSWCGRIRDEDGEWRTLEAYVEETSDTLVTHGMCPVCEAELVEGREGKGA